ncbi:MAG TPA: hypothetical protein VGM50_05230 [Gemmatimonadaceae bacterium]
MYDFGSGDPIEGVRVGDLLSGTFATTSLTGTVALSFLPDGGGMVRIQRLGYEPQTMFVALTPADTAPITTILKPAVKLDAVVTTADSSRFLSPALRAFEERRRAGTGGYFIDGPELRKLENTTLGNATRRFPGITLMSGPFATWLMPNVRCQDGTHAGPPAVYLDGIPWTPSPRHDAPHLLGRDKDGIGFNLDDFEISSLAGVEFYADNTQLPIGLDHNARRCGALFLWTRDR